MPTARASPVSPRAHGVAPPARTPPALHVVTQTEDAVEATRVVSALVAGYLRVRAVRPPPPPRGAYMHVAAGGGSTHVAHIVLDIDDTLLLDVSASDAVAVPHAAVAGMMTELRARFGARIALHFVTARRDDPDTRAWTVRQLTAAGFPPTAYATLALAPAAVRGSATSISHWKHAERLRIAAAAGTDVVVTGGDQWSDLVPLECDDDLATMDDAYAVYDKPFVVVRLGGRAGLYGLKLRDRAHA